MENELCGGKLLIRVRYVGTDYCGYQVQPSGVTVQQRLNEAARELFGFDCDIVGCSRTDSGVHANDFCATVTMRGKDSLPTQIPLGRIPLALTAHLPEDICVFDARRVPTDFHARYGVIEKEYLYRVWNSPIRNPFEKDRAAHFPRPIGDEALARMREAAALFLGTHDFSAFTVQGCEVESTVRTVTKSTVEREGDLILYRVAADGFLYRMVRILVGTLLDVAEGRRTIEDVAAALASGDRARVGFTAPACGLYLDRVTYPDERISEVSP